MVTPTLLIPPDIPENKPILHTPCTFMDSLAQTLELKILYCLSSVREADAIYSVTATSTRKPILVILTVEAMMKATVGEKIPSNQVSISILVRLEVHVHPQTVFNCDNKYWH